MKIISVLLLSLLLLTACSRYSSHYKATVFVHSNTTTKADMRFSTFEGTMVFKLDCRSGSGTRIQYSAQLESGSARVLYDSKGKKNELFSIGAGDEISGTGGELDNGTVYILVESDRKCEEGKFHFELATTPDAENAAESGESAAVADAENSTASVSMPSEYDLDQWAKNIFDTALESGKRGDAPALPLSGKSVLVFCDSKNCNVYNKYSMKAKTDPHPDDPFFQPVFSDGEPIFPEVPVSVWADSTDACDYLILYGGFETDRVEGFYEGGADRVSTETIVYVIDPKEKQILLTKSVGKDVPRNVTDHPQGRVMYDEAEEYIQELLIGTK